MSKRTLHPSELVLGQPLPCDAYDARGVLLLRKGELLISQNQIDRLLELANFDAIPDDPPPDAEAVPRSPLAQILEARRRLTDCLATPAGDFVATIDRIAGQIARAVRRNADVALAAILLVPEGAYPCRHAVNAAIACELVGQALALSPPLQRATVAAALTMNIGMLDLQRQLHAAAAPPDDAQRAAIRAHCTSGVALLKAHGVDDTHWLQAVEDHHERADGSGYPAGKTLAELDLPARLLALADVYCAAVSARAHRRALSPHTALRRLFLSTGALDEELAALFIKTLGIYPPGTGVRLRNGSIAVVLERGASCHKPKVASLTTHDGLRTGVPIRRRGDQAAHAVAETVDLEALALPVDMEALWGADAAL